jgi:hypothetical protein
MKVDPAEALPIEMFFRQQTENFLMLRHPSVGQCR